MHRTLVWLLPVLFICLSVSAQDAERIPLKIGKDTTYFSGPVTEDGIIDYVAALNKHYGEGIAQDDNAFALLAQLHPRQTPDASEHQVFYWDRLFEVLGIEPDDAMPSLLTRWQYAADAGLEDMEFEAMVDEAMQGPWTKKELPHVHAWMLANTGVMEKVDEALERPHYFAPLIRTSDDETLPAILLPQLGFLREAGRLIGVHGMYALAQGDVATTFDAAIRLRKFGKLVSYEPTLIGVLVGISLQNMQRELSEALAEAGSLSQQEVVAYLDAHARVGAVETVGRAIAQHERLMTLDTIQRAWAGARTDLHFFTGQGDEGARRAAKRMDAVVRSRFFDINRSLRAVNKRYDELATISAIKDRGQRKKAYEDFNEAVAEPDTIKRISMLFRIAAIDALPEGWTPDRYTDEVTGVYTLLLMADAESTGRTQKRSQTRRLVEATAISLLGYRDQHGELPASLDALVPGYFDEVPIDFATGKPLVYRVNDDGSALVYSLGENLKDDGGVDDYAEGDIAVRIGTGKP